jgi:hypothetical protein
LAAQLLTAAAREGVGQSKIRKIDAVMMMFLNLLVTGPRIVSGAG